MGVAVLVCGLTSCIPVEKGYSQGSTLDANPKPVLVQSRVNATLSNLVISNESGDCLQIRNAHNVTIEGAQIGPCAGHGIDISASSGITIRQSRIVDTRGNGVNVFQTDGLAVVSNTIERNAGAVYVHKGTRIQIKANTFRDVRGPQPRGQFVQFNDVSGGDNAIACNVGTNSPGRSSPEDTINVFGSHGLPQDPIRVIGNRITGGGPSSYGGGILLGDGGGSWQLAQDNVLTDPGQFGIAVAGGQNIAVKGNLIYGRSQPFTNVGIYVWNQYSGACSGVSVGGNIVEWWSKEGRRNSRWNADNCGPIEDWDSNLWDAVVHPDFLKSTIRACADCTGEACVQ
jgi:hypothetical protein